MAIFSSTPRDPEVNQMRRRTDHTTLSIIAKDLTVSGDLTTEGVVKIEGKVKGTIRAMWYGTVTRAWARQHHRAWYREMTGK